MAMSAGFKPAADIVRFALAERHLKSLGHDIIKLDYTCNLQPRKKATRFVHQRVRRVIERHAWKVGAATWTSPYEGDILSSKTIAAYICYRFQSGCNIKAPLMLHIIKKYEWLIGAECRLHPRHLLSTKQVFY